MIIRRFEISISETQQPELIFDGDWLVEEPLDKYLRLPRVAEILDEQGEICGYEILLSKARKTLEKDGKKTKAAKNPAKKKTITKTKNAQLKTEKQRHN